MRAVENILETIEEAGRMNADKDIRYRLQSVDDALSLVSLLLRSDRRMNLTELTAASGISKNKTFRLLKTLELRGVIDKDTQERYYCGINTFIVARHALNRMEMPEVFPFLKKVAAHLNEDVYLARETKGQAVLVAVANSSQNITIRSYVGSLLRESPVEKNKGSRNHNQTDYGFNVSMGVLDAEITTVAIDIPVFSERECGKLVVVAPTFRMSPERIRSEVIPVLQGTVRQMGRFQAESMVRMSHAAPVLRQNRPAREQLGTSI